MTKQFIGDAAAIFSGVTFGSPWLDLHLESKVWTHSLNFMSFLSISRLSKLQFVTEVLRSTYEHTWNCVENNKSVHIKIVRFAFGNTSIFAYLAHNFDVFTIYCNIESCKDKKIAREAVSKLCYTLREAYQYTLYVVMSELSPLHCRCLAPTAVGLWLRD